MQNFVLISPNFPDTYYMFAEALKINGFRVLGIGDCPYERLAWELKTCLDDYYCWSHVSFKSDDVAFNTDIFSSLT